MDFEVPWSPSENKGQRTRQLNGLASMGTPSGHHLLSPAVLYKRFNRHERSMLSQDRSIHPSKFVYIRATTTHRRHHTENSVSVMTESLWKKREVDIISRYKCWINEDLHRWSFDKPLKIVYHWYLKYIWTQDIFLGDCAMAFPFHVVDDFIPENTS